MGVVNQMSLAMCSNTHEMIPVHTMNGDVYGHLCKDRRKQESPRGQWGR